MAYQIQVRKHVVSDYDEDGHPLDGEVREIEPETVSTFSPDALELEEHGSAVEWAKDYLSNHLWVTDMTSWPVNENTACTRSDASYYRDYRTNVTAYLVGPDWSMADREEIFRAVAPWCFPKSA